ncbi:hypothetical protein TNCV_1433211 [Trichonephila clavipes]|nr:hypothetical protein TNCV_1433211 [Trichonephila clavipes]
MGVTGCKLCHWSTPKSTKESRIGDNHIKIMFDPSSFANPTPLAHADTSRDVLPRGGKSQMDHHVSSLPSGIADSDADCCAGGPGFESQRRHGCL